MLITSIRLRNYKSYADATVRFRPGTNAITGANGAGKSTLLEAIGFALFNHRPDSLANCLREGTESGSVTVGIVSSFDEREYEVERSFTSRATSRYRVLDMELGGVVLVEGNEDVQGWLRQHLAVSPVASLEALFENAVGVPQGTYTAPFQQPASVRKAVFDPLLQVEEYGQASDRLLEAQHHIAEILNDLDKRIARAEGLVARLPELEAERRTLDGDVDELGDQVADLETRLGARQVELERWDLAERRLREAAERATRAEVDAATQERLLDHAVAALDEARAAAERVAAARAGHAAYLEAEKLLASLEVERAGRDALREERRRLEGELARVAERSLALEGALEAIESAAQEMVELEPLVRHQEELETALSAAQKEARQLELARRGEAQAADELKATRRDLQACREGLERAEALQEQLTRLRERLESLTEEGRACGERRAAAHAELARLEEQAGVLEATTTARCPVCEGELTPEHRQEILARNRTQIGDLRSAVAAHERAIAAHRREYRRLAAEAEGVERSLRDLPGESRLRELTDALQRRETAWMAAREQVDALSSAVERVDRLESQLNALGNPRRAYQRCEDAVDGRDRLLRGRAELEGSLRRARAAAERLDGELGRYADLDARLGSAQRARALYQADHDAYLANLQTAEQHDARARHAEDTRAALAAARLELQAAGEAAEDAEAAYDGTAHAAARADVEALGRELATAQALHEEKRARLDAVRGELKELRKVRSDLRAWRNEHAEQSRLRDVLRTVRELLRKAGPYITQQLVRQISREASRLYGDIMNDYSGQLHWSDDYDIALEVRGHQRTFRQLSGGEQMSAALAVRLAALRETSSIDVALFDEPTAHLDPDRRDSLADSILQVKGFSQLFVISHDDTFERAAQNYVRIVKDEGGSHPERSQIA